MSLSSNAAPVCTLAGDAKHLVRTDLKWTLGHITRDDYRMNAVVNAQREESPTCHER